MLLSISNSRKCPRIEYHLSNLSIVALKWEVIVMINSRSSLGYGIYVILENLVLMYLMNCVLRCPVNKCLCLLEDISPKILPSQLKRNEMQRYKAS